MKKFKAFTLAEVLVTLGVIGVIATMTLPILINKYQEKVTVNKVKKFYAMMNQAFLLSVKDNGYANEWNVSNGRNQTTANQLATYLKPYLKIIKDCGTQSGCLNYTTIHKTLNNVSQNLNYDTETQYYKVILSDGSYIWWRGVRSYCNTSEVGVANSCAVIFFDINGSKQPNVVGKDIFLVLMTPYALKTSDGCSTSNYGWGCLGYILQNGNMNYLH